MAARLRNMTGVYLSCGDKMLLLYRQGGRVVSDTWVPSAGGHFEKDELNDPEACVLRELNEELGLTREDLDSLRLRYIGLRNAGEEIRQNYYYFANVRPEKAEGLASNEGQCRWVAYEDVLERDMPKTAKAVLTHYLRSGRFDDKLYAAVSDGETYHFIEMER